MQRVTGTSFAVMMIDIDIPTNSPPQTNTLLHWMQTGLTQSQTATVMNTTGGSMSVFLMQMPGAVQAAAPYFGPSPPARTPLAHRYTELVLDTSTASQESMNILLQAAQTRMGFNAEEVVTRAGLQDKVIAGNFFVVTNPGPAQDSASAGGLLGGGAASNSTIGNGAGTAGNAETPGQLAGAAPSRQASALFASIAVVGAAFFCL